MERKVKYVSGDGLSANDRAKAQELLLIMMYQVWRNAEEASLSLKELLWFPISGLLDDLRYAGLIKLPANEDYRLYQHMDMDELFDAPITFTYEARIGMQNIQWDA